jgi:hypothetical protein
VSDPGSTYPVCIVTYFPSALAVERIQAVSKQWPIWIFDNTPKGGKGSPWGQEIQVLGTGRNEGLGYAMHTLMKAVRGAGYTKALYFDQDTVFGLSSLSWIQAWLQDHEEQIPDFAVLNFLPSSSCDSSLPGLVKPIQLMINSGSLFDLATVEKVGYHRSTWFLECVDYELVLRMARAGFRLGAVNGCPGLDHEQEQPSAQINRIYPIKRSLVFVGRLLQLSFRALVFGPRSYAWLFLRNVLTHCVSQSGYVLQKFMGGRKR